MSGNWDKTVTAAMKVLGDQGKVPPMPDALTTGLDKGRESIDEVTAVVADLQSKLVTMEKACGDVVRAGQKFQASLGKETFGLDPKKPDDNKKIQKARGLLDAFLTKANQGTGDALVPMSKFDNALNTFARDIAGA